MKSLNKGKKKSINPLPPPNKPKFKPGEDSIHIFPYEDSIPLE